MTATTKPKTVTLTKSQEVANDVTALLKARNPLLWIVSNEEERVEGHLFNAIVSAKFSPRIWDIAEGVVKGLGESRAALGPETAEPGAVLKLIRAASKVKEQAPPEQKEKGAWILRGFPTFITGQNGVRLLRQLQNNARELPNTKLEVAQSMIILSPHVTVPPEIAAMTTVIEWPMPDRREMAQLLEDAITPQRAMFPTGIPAKLKEAATDAAVGLSGPEALSCFSRSLINRRLDPVMISKEKRRIVAREGLLEWYDPLPGGLEAVGGLDVLKGWLIERTLAFGADAREYGLSAPRGTLLIGISGCLHADTPIYDPVAKTNLTVAEREQQRKSFHVWSRNPLGSATIAMALPPVKYHEDEMIEIDFENGEKLTVTQNHRFISEGRELWAHEVYARLQANELCRLETSSVSDLEVQTEGDLRLTQKAQGYLDDCLHGRSVACDERPLLELIAVQAIQTSQDDAHGCNPDYSHSDVQDDAQGRNHPYLQSDRPSKPDFSRQQSSPALSVLPLQSIEAPNKLCLVTSPTGRQHHLELNQKDIGQPLVVSAQVSSAVSSASVASNVLSSDRYIRVRAARKVGRLVFYDFHVPVLENYWAAGVWHHNCGKSLTAKATATAFDRPLLRLDLGAIKNSLVGSSERNLRRVFEMIRSIGRCVVWLDEVEKALAGAINGARDGGVSADALGALLTWMQEQRGEAFIIATANDISGLPPEFLRKGRFDEIFFIDLPNFAERVEVLKAALREYKRGDVKIDYKKVATACDRFTSSEIAAIVPDALYAGFADNAREIRTADLLNAASKVVPLSKTAGPKIAELRSWAKNNARHATSPEKQESIPAHPRFHRQLDIDPEQAEI